MNRLILVMFLVVCAGCAAPGVDNNKTKWAWLTGDPDPSLANVPGWTKFHEGNGWSYQ